MPSRPKPDRLPRVAAALMVASLASAAGSAPASGQTALDHAALYQDCMARARLEPEEALMVADAWALAGGGDAADHCSATALFTLGRYDDAAARLEDLAARVQDAQPALAADILSQAATAYRLLQRDVAALAVLDRAVALAPDDGGLLLERAKLRGRQGDFADALADLDRAQPLLPDDPEVYLLRAAARRRLGALELALGDVEAGLALDPGSPELLLERGNIRRLRRDPEGARADWAAVIAAAPGSAAAHAAEVNLQRLAGP